MVQEQLKLVVPVSGQLQVHPSNTTNTTNQRLNPNLQREELDVARATFLNFEGWSWSMIFHR